ncbi:hypothetical protein CLIM01_00974, partial [Colletotrichum limetticola]
TSTQRLLFRKVKKGFTEQAWQLATAQQQLAFLRAQVTNTAVRKRRVVQVDPNTKFANIRDIHQAQIEAGEKEVIAAESSDSDCPSEAGSCIVQFVPTSTPKNLGRRGEVAGSSQGQEGWPRAEVLAVIGFFVTPGIAMFYKDVREVIVPRAYRWVVGRQRVQEDEENSEANGFLPLENNELPVWVNIEEELRAGVEQWKD